MNCVYILTTQINHCLFVFSNIFQCICVGRQQQTKPSASKIVSQDMILLKEAHTHTDILHIFDHISNKLKLVKIFKRLQFCQHFSPFSQL